MGDKSGEDEKRCSLNKTSEGQRTVTMTSEGTSMGEGGSGMWIQERELYPQH